jgi:hypothetical protein
MTKCSCGFEKCDRNSGHRILFNCLVENFEHIMYLSNPWSGADESVGSNSNESSPFMSEGDSLMLYEWTLTRLQVALIRFVLVGQN